MEKNTGTFLQQNLRTLLKNNNMSQAQLAKKAGISIDTVKKIFRNRSNDTAYIPSASTLECIAGVFNVTPEILLQPNISKLIYDVEVENDIKLTNMFNAKIQKADPATRFRNAMLEVGYNSVVPVIDYLQFTGYEIAFTYDGARYATEEEVKEVSNELKRIREYHKQQIIKYEKQILKYKVKIRKAEDRLTKVKSNKKRRRTRNKLFLYNDKLGMTIIDKMVMEIQDRQFDELNKKKHAELSSMSEVIAARRIEIDEAIQAINEIDKLSKDKRNEYLEELPITVLIRRGCDFEQEPKKMTIGNFYHMCERIRQFVEEQIQ